MNEIQQGLLIAAIGMGLVFGVIIFLWGLMALMMRLTSRQGSVENAPAEVNDAEIPLVPDLNEGENQRRAAALAVAVGLAVAASQRTEPSRVQREAATEPSAWQSFHRNRQLENKTK